MCCAISYQYQQIFQAPFNAHPKTGINFLPQTQPKPCTPTPTLTHQTTNHTAHQTTHETIPQRTHNTAHQTLI